MITPGLDPKSRLSQRTDDDHRERRAVSEPATSTTTAALKLAVVTGALRMVGGPFPGGDRSRLGKRDSYGLVRTTFSAMAHDGNFATENSLTDAPCGWL